MDEFLQDIYMSVFHQWILNQPYDSLVTVSEDDEDIVLETPSSVGRITFNPNHIIELIITDKTTGSNDFYLHFQMRTLNHAVALYQEMVECLTNKKNITQVLLCCSGGYTTSNFAVSLNETVELFDVPFHFSASSISHIDSRIKGMTIVLLAPQVAYLRAELEKKYPDVEIAVIPSAVFARYDCVELLRFIRDLNDQHHKDSTPLSLKRKLSHHEKILVLSVINMHTRYIIDYRLYDQDNAILMDQEVVKTRIDFEDICDILDVVFVSHPDIELIGISMPGIINDGKVYLSMANMYNFDALGMLKRKYNKTFYLDNDVNSIAVGIYVSQGKYESLSFIFQPKSSYAGVGSIFNGQLIRGYHNVAGEVQYMPLNLKEDYLTMTGSAEGTTDVLTKVITSIISLLGPEAVLYSTPNQVDEKAILEGVSKMIPKEYQPEIKRISSLKEYMLIGEMTLCVLASHH